MYAPTPEIYTLSLHDALPICLQLCLGAAAVAGAHHRGERLASNPVAAALVADHVPPAAGARSEEHTSELQSHSDLVCRLLLEKKKKNFNMTSTPEFVMIFLSR